MMDPILDDHAVPRTDSRQPERMDPTAVASSRGPRADEEHRTHGRRPRVHRPRQHEARERLTRARLVGL
jgi:hypothetical protein